MPGKGTRSLSETYAKRAFQILAELEVQNTVYGAVQHNSNTIYNWAKNLLVDLHMPEYTCDFNKSWSGQEAHVIYDPDSHYFCLNTVNPDGNVARRSWITEAEITEKNGKIMLAVKLSYTTPIDQDFDDVDFSVPRFMRDIYRYNGLRDVWKLQSRAHKINTDDIESLRDVILDSERKMPVVVITERDEDWRANDPYQDEYLVDGDELANDSGMIAHIVMLDSEATRAWNDITGTDWGVYNGAVRTYYPGVDFDSDEYMNHPLALPTRILEAYYERDDGTELIMGQAFEQILKEKLEKYNTSMHIEWKKLGYKFYFTARRERILNEREQYQADKESADKWVSEAEDYLEEIDRLENENEALEGDLEKMDGDLQEKKSQIYSLNARVRELEDQIREFRDDNNTDIPILDNYDELASWVKKYFPARLVLLNKAQKSLKKAQFNDVELIYKSLKLLGTTYWEMKSGSGASLKEFTDQCQKLGIEEDASISETSEGSLGETYMVDYHHGRRKLDRHLKKGVTRDQRNCMRIYFFWDDDDEVVVIGSLPYHLRTTNT